MVPHAGHSKSAVGCYIHASAAYIAGGIVPGDAAAVHSEGTTAQNIYAVTASVPSANAVIGITEILSANARNRLNTLFLIKFPGILNIPFYDSITHFPSEL